MKERFAEIFEAGRREGVDIPVKLVGERPCSSENVNEEELERMRRVTSRVVMDVLGVEKEFGSSSTDCNIPMSLGIPGITIGVYQGGGAHTREEWIRKDSMPTGLQIGILTSVGITNI